MSGRGTAAVVLALCVSVGVIGGVVLDRVLLIPHHIGRRPARGARPVWPASQEASRDRLARELALTDAQRTQLDSVLSRQTARYRATREQIQPQMDSIFQQTRAQIDSMLTPPQREQLKTIRDRNVFGFPPGLGPRPGDSSRPRRRGRPPGE
jgi:Spy/CpxP family protein refolding chaperone